MAAATETLTPTVEELLDDATTRLDRLLPHLRPGTVAWELHRIAAQHNAALRAIAERAADGGAR